ncbi:unnamed protein product [Bursaphelenchus xylophilus]|uniref:(pine wood nematode) hypothetical protein n=1 Tax=Bursaphelenchus xylophilus TaxID=6326 RepID=A0A1I7RZZ9_BURXY|nr:unnamed protein product [Bursaphelenchus xylophilus]CAG9109120.1 unnamed protein product [Bursaphelenchus xylophilus]
MFKLKWMRNFCLSLFAVVGVLQIRQTIVTSDDITHSRATRSASFSQEVTEIKQIRIRTVKDGEYCIAANIVQGSLNETDRITLVLHLSSDRLNTHKLMEHTQNWDGPISLSVVFPENMQLNASDVRCAISKLQSLMKSDRNAQEKLSAHFILKNVTCEDFVEPDLTREKKLANCQIRQKSMTSEEKARNMLKYPVNKARNTARKFVSTDYILSADMDHFFSKNFEPKMRKLAKEVLSENNKTVLVYRIFEIDGSVKTHPQTKEDLHRLFLTYKAQEFHKYYGAHNIPKLYEWFKSDEKTDQTSVQFYKPYTSNSWEPQFVSTNKIPFHDETFKYPQRDNTVLRWEMCRAGYKFAIVDDVYMYHLGFKEPSELKLTNRARQIFRKQFYGIIKNFNKRIDRQYPSTKHKCPNFDYYSV